MHLNGLVDLIEDDRAVTACNHCQIVLVCLYTTHLWVNGSNIADLGAPEWPILLHVEVLVPLADLVRLWAATVVNIKARLDK